MKRLGWIFSLSLVLILIGGGSIAWACDAQKTLAAGGPEKCAFKTARYAELLEEAKQVELVGRVLCASCDMKEADSHCGLVFRVEGDSEAVYTLVNTDALTELAKITSHGEQLVTISGKAASEGEYQLLSVESFKTKS